MKLKLIEGRILKNNADLIPQILEVLTTTTSQPTEIPGLVKLGQVDNGRLPIYYLKIGECRKRQIPPFALAAYMPNNKYNKNYAKLWGDLPQGLYIFDSFRHLPDQHKREVLEHELVHYADPKVELPQHQNYETTFGSDAEKDAIITTIVTAISKRAKQEPQIIPQIRTALQSGNVTALINLSQSMIRSNPNLMKFPRDWAKKLLVNTYNEIFN